MHVNKVSYPQILPNHVRKHLYIVSLPICCVGYYKVAGHWPDFSNADDMKTVGAEAFAFVNFARLAVPLRIGLALSTTSWVDENIVQKFMKDEPAKSAEDIAKEVNNLPYNNSPLLNEALASYPVSHEVLRYIVSWHYVFAEPTNLNCL